MQAKLKQYYACLHAHTNTCMHNVAFNLACKHFTTVQNITSRKMKFTSCKSYLTSFQGKHFRYYIKCRYSVCYTRNTSKI